MTEFFAMGGHGLYVWLAYGISLAVLVGLGLRLIVARRRFVAIHQRSYPPAQEVGSTEGE